MPAPRFLTLIGSMMKLATAAQMTTGMATGAVVVATREDGLIDPSFLPDSEQTIREASEALDAGDAVNIWNDAGTFKVRKADASSFSTKADGFVTDNYALGEMATVYSEGKVTGLTGLTDGPVFLSTTSGEVTQTPPTGAGEIWQEVGEATSTTELRIELGNAIEL